MKRCFHWCCCCCCFCACCCWNCCYWSQKPTFKVWLKSDQEQWRYCWWWVAVGGGGGGVSRFRVKPIFCYVRLSWVEVELGLWQQTNKQQQQKIMSNNWILTTSILVKFNVLLPSVTCHFQTCYYSQGFLWLTGNLQYDFISLHGLWNWHMWGD